MRCLPLPPSKAPKSNLDLNYKRISNCSGSRLRVRHEARGDFSKHKSFNESPPKVSLASGRSVSKSERKGRLKIAALWKPVVGQAVQDLRRCSAASRLARIHNFRHPSSAVYCSFHTVVYTVSRTEYSGPGLTLCHVAVMAQVSHQLLYELRRRIAQSSYPRSQLHPHTGSRHWPPSTVCPDTITHFRSPYRMQSSFPHASLSTKWLRMVTARCYGTMLIQKGNIPISSSVPLVVEVSLAATYTSRTH
ncbi:hypothetical protein BJ170DRAFT_208490 [Xylariales sp. AK1849]|nr:hypothetical protein BJ170DRAFT_208490 [Xylariales sp. AK1849]